MSYTIAAMDENGGIGRQGTIPWSNTPEGHADMMHFKKLTKNNAVIMGWNTYKSIGRLLPNRLNIIVTMKHFSEAPMNEDGICVTFTDIDEAVKYGRQFELLTGKKCYIIGGEMIYKYYFSRYNPIEEHVTILPGNYQ